MVLLLANTPATVEAFQDFHLEAQAGQGQGDHSLTYENDQFGMSNELYRFPIKGNTLAVGNGYRWALDQSGFRLGLEAMAHFGEFSSSQSWETKYGLADATAEFTIGTVYTVGLEAGYVLPNHPWYLYGELGYSAAKTSVCGQVRLLEASVSGCSDGWAIGPYWALGVSRNLADFGFERWSLGLEYQHFSYEGTDDLLWEGHDLGSLRATADQQVLAVTLSMEF